jgi:hypothetical protein
MLLRTEAPPVATDVAPPARFEPPSPRLPSAEAPPRFLEGLLVLPPTLEALLPEELLVAPAILAPPCVALPVFALAPPTPTWLPRWPGPPAANETGEPSLLPPQAQESRAISDPIPIDEERMLADSTDMKGAA